jgi:plasmid maintenance system antidote protein VapI
MASDLFKKLLERVPKETQEEVHRSMATATRLHKFMRAEGISETKLVKMMDESADNIDRWLTGMYSFTTQDLIKIEALFDKFASPVSKKGNTLKIVRSENKLQAKQSKLIKKSHIIDSDKTELVTPPQKKYEKTGRGKFATFSISTQASIVIEK